MAEIGKEHRVFNVRFPPARADGNPAFQPASGSGEVDDTPFIQEAIDVLSAHRNGEMALVPDPDAAIEGGMRVPDKKKQGGTIYFPPGKYLIGLRHTPPEARFDPAQGVVLPQNTRHPALGTVLFVPEDICLEFAPGARLVFVGPRRNANQTVDDGPRIEIEGSIKAGLHQIFDVWTPMKFARNPVSERRGGMPPSGDVWVEDRRRPGAVLITGGRVAEVFPEWWGALGQPGALGLRGAAHELQAACDVAMRDRSLAGRSVNFSAVGVRSESALTYSRTGLTVMLSAGIYTIERTVMLEGGTFTGNNAGFRIVGNQPLSNTGVGHTTLLGAFEPGALHHALENDVPLAILFIKTAFGFSIESVNFEVGFLTRGSPAMAETASDLYVCRTGLWVEGGIRDSRGLIDRTTVGGTLHMGIVGFARNCDTDSGASTWPPVRVRTLPPLLAGSIPVLASARA
jgi:hypothetical protein